MSVFKATYCTPGRRAEIMRFTALEPPPPTPTTLIGGRVSKWLAIGLPSVGDRLVTSVQSVLLRLVSSEA